MGKRSAFGAMTDDERSALGDRVARVVREFRTQAQAAQAADLSVDQLARIMQGKAAPTAMALARLAMEAGYSINWIVAGVGDPRMEWPTYEAARALVAHPVMQIKQQIQQLEQQRALGDEIGRVYEKAGFKLSASESADVCGAAIDTLTESGFDEAHWPALSVVIVRCHVEALEFAKRHRR